MTNDIPKIILWPTMIVVGLLIVTPMAHAQSKKRRTTIRNTTLHAKQQIKAPPLGVIAFQQFWNQLGAKRFTKCEGDSYLYHDELSLGDQIEQYKGPWDMSSDNLSEADALNGVEYRGRPSFDWRLARVRRNGVWGPWFTSDTREQWNALQAGLRPGGQFMNFPYVSRVNGQWRIYWTIESDYMWNKWFEDAERLLRQA